MTLKDHLLKMLESEIWANQLLVQTFEKAKDPDERSLLLFSHITSSYNAWLSRIHATEITVTLFQERTLEESKQLLQHTLSELKKYLVQADDKEVNRIIHFTFPLDGSQRKLSVTDAITHLVTHSSYHRGQILARLKERVETLPLTTYIGFATTVVKENKV
jgi:uncharacterized damage-inducible protein DinB